MPEQARIPAILIAALLAGGGGSVATDMLNPPRPDPWTGSMDAERMHQAEKDWHEDLNQTEDRFTKQLDSMERRLNSNMNRGFEDIRTLINEMHKAR